MHVAPYLKSAGFLGAAAFAAVSMSVIAVAMQLGPATRGAGSAAVQVEQAEAGSDEPSANAPIDTRRSHSDAQKNAAQKTTATAAAPAKQAAPEPSMNSVDESPTFVRPSGETPSWLRSGEEDLSTSEKMRDKLRQSVEVKFVGLPLRQVLDHLLKENGLPFALNEKELDNLSVDPDTPITMSVGEMPLCEALELILEPLSLRYEVNPQYVKISSADDLNGAVRYYDLAYVLPTSASVRGLVNAIESTIHYEGWASQGGESSISVVGSMMVVNCSEKAHRQIEKLLAELAKVDPQNLRSPGFSNQPAGGMGGMGGGGMGGGMF